MSQVDSSTGGPTNARRRPCRRGSTLIEQALAALILAIAALGALQFQYFAAGQGRIARVQIAATRAAQLLMEDWKSTGGSAEYDPAGLGVGFSQRDTVPSGFTTAEGLGTTLNDAVYGITLADVSALAMLKYLDVAHDSPAKITLRQLAVIVRFGEIDSGGHLSAPESRFAEMPPITLVTYVRLDATDG